MGSNHRPARVLAIASVLMVLVSSAALAVGSPVSNLTLSAVKDAPVTFRIPVFSTHLTDPGFYCIKYYVDQDPLEGLLDWYCLARTYDGHKGTDFSSWPYPWYKMDHNEVKVAAAADGVVYEKYDEETNDRCTTGHCGDATDKARGNYVAIQHADGSIAYYCHLKYGSVTSKEQGQPVVKGEVLGTVGSSGNSTGPHLHFEVWDSEGELVDPYSGECNSMNVENWWDGFQSYYEHDILAAFTHDDYPDYPTPPGQEVPHRCIIFNRGDTIYFSAYVRDVLTGDEIQFKVRKPDGNEKWRWDVVETDPPNPCASYESEYRTLSTEDPLGEWTYEVSYRDQLYTHHFYVEPDGPGSTVRIYMESMTAEIDGDEIPAKYCHRAEEEAYQHTSNYGFVDMTRRVILAADMTAIPEEATITAVEPGFWAKKIWNTGSNGSFAIFANSGHNNHEDCEECMDWVEAFSNCDIDYGGTGNRLFLDSSPSIGRYTNYPLHSLLDQSDLDLILQHAIDAHANYSQHNHYLFFYLRIQIGDGPISATGDGLVYGADRTDSYRPYVDVTYEIGDLHPPVPDPSEWAEYPNPPIANASSLTMAAVEASDPSSPVEYYFECVSGGPGCDDSGWITSTEYTDTGLSPNTEYAYTVKTKDSAAPPNVGTASDLRGAHTNAEIPSVPQILGTGETTIDLHPDRGTNPEDTQLAIWNATDGYWVTSDGGDGSTSPTWQTEATWGTVTVTGLMPECVYCFALMARNDDSLATALSDTSCIKTMPDAAVPSIPQVHNFRVSEALPNPSGAGVSILLELPTAEQVKISVYDVAGRPVANLVDEVLSQGRHPITWDGRSGNSTAVPPGIYFCRVVAGPKNATRKIVVIR